MKRLKNNLPRARAQDRHTFILDECRGRSVLHLGCVDKPFLEDKLSRGTLLHARIAAEASHLVGLDNDLNGLRLMNAHGWETLVADAEQIGSCLAETTHDFDVAIAGEIIEHLNNPGLFLDGLATGLKPGTEVVFTAPNAYASFRFVRLMFGREDVHPDHVAYYSFHTLRTLLERHGYVIESAYPYSMGAELPDIRWFWQLTERVTMALQPWTGDGVIIVARTPSAPQRAECTERSRSTCLTDESPKRADYVW